MIIEQSDPNFIKICERMCLKGITGFSERVDIVKTDKGYVAYYSRIWLITPQDYYNFLRNIK